MKGIYLMREMVHGSGGMVALMRECMKLRGLRRRRQRRRRGRVVVWMLRIGKIRILKAKIFLPWSFIIVRSKLRRIGRRRRRARHGGEIGLFDVGSNRGFEKVCEEEEDNQFFCFVPALFQFFSSLSIRGR